MALPKLALVEEQIFLDGNGNCDPAPYLLRCPVPVEGHPGAVVLVAPPGKVLARSMGGVPSESTAKCLSPRSIPTTRSGFAGGRGTSGISNSAVRLTYQCPSASRLKVAPLMGQSIGWLWRILTQPTLGT